MRAEAWCSPDRPLSQASLAVQGAWLAAHAQRGIVLQALSSTLLLGVVYLLFRHLLPHPLHALAAAGLYALLPNKLDLYHTSLYVVANVGYSLYAGALLGFVRFARSGSALALGTALLCYSGAVFWTEVGFLLPLLLLLYARLFAPGRVRAAAVFLVPALAYVAIRWSGGVCGTEGIGREPLPENILGNILGAAPGHLVGRYVIRAVVYGADRFFDMERPWTWLLLGLDLVVVGVVVRAAGAWPSLRLDRPLSIWAGVTTLAMLVPSLLYVVESRHLGLADIGFSLLLLHGLSFLGGRSRRTLIAVGVCVLLVVSQGTGWSQVVACRLNRSVYEALAERKTEVEAAERVLIDMGSFAERIPYTWGERTRNRLHNYFGMQALAPWGLRSMVRLATESQAPAHVTLFSPRARGDLLEIDEPVTRTELVTRVIPAPGTLVVDFAFVFPNGYSAGRRAAENVTVR